MSLFLGIQETSQRGNKDLDGKINHLETILNFLASFLQEAKRRDIIFSFTDLQSYL